jgi:hypothetical protein
MGELLAIVNKLEKQLFSAQKTRTSLLDFQASKFNFPSNYPQPHNLLIPSYRTEIAHAAFLAARGALYVDFKKKLLILDLDRATMEEEALREQLHNEFIPIRIGTNNENTRFIPPKALIQRVNQLLPPVSQEHLCQFLFDFENNRRQAGVSTPGITSFSTGGVTNFGPPADVVMVGAESDLSIVNLNERGPLPGSKKSKPEVGESTAPLEMSKRQRKREREKEKRRENRKKKLALLLIAKNQGKGVKQGRRRRAK